MPTWRSERGLVMVVRPEVVRRKLLEIEQAVARLRSWAPITLERLETDLLLQWAVERGLQLAAEALFDAGNHLLAGELHEVVTSYREIPVRLAARGVLSPATAQRLRGLAGFRNVLVHDYAEVDLAKVHAAIERLGDLTAFARDVERWLADRGA
jgi:uncharacterized protein YutE (UPF0331/DUF86 family)